MKKIIFIMFFSFSCQSVFEISSDRSTNNSKEKRKTNNQTSPHSSKNNSNNTTTPTNNINNTNNKISSTKGNIKNITLSNLAYQGSKLKLVVKFSIQKNQKLITILEDIDKTEILKSEVNIQKDISEIEIVLDIPADLKPAKNYQINVSLYDNSTLVDKKTATIEIQKMVPKIIFDTDFGDDADDMLALMMLNYFQDRGECEIIAVGQCNDQVGAVAGIDSINTYYGRPNIPIGQLTGSAPHGDETHLSFLLNNYPELSDLPDDAIGPDAVALYRKVLAEAPDKSVRIISVGLKRNMARLIKSQADKSSALNGVELIKKKVFAVYDMGGFFPDGSNEFNYGQTPGDTQYYIENWPTRMVLLGARTEAIHLGSDLRTKDTPTGRTLNHKLEVDNEFEQAGYDCAAILAAVRGEERYFNMVEGCNHVNDDSSNYFDREDKSCNHAYGDFVDNQKISFEDLAKEIRVMINAPPKSLK